MNRAIVFAALAAALPAAAQSSSGWTEYRPATTFFTTGYQMSQPIGDLHTYADSSFRGLTFDGRSLLTKSISAGLRFFWNRYYKADPQPVQSLGSNATISGPVFHFADQFALEGTVHYYFGNSHDATVLPYAGFGI